MFHSLNEAHISEIVTLMANQLRNRLIEQGIDFILTDEAKKFLAKEGFDPAYGARPLRRSIQRNIEDRLSEELLVGNIKQGDTVAIHCEDGKIKIEKATKSVSQK